MGNDENKKTKRRHIYDELNRSIDSFTSCDDYYSDDNTKKKRSNLKSKNKYKTKYKSQKHKKFSNDEQLNNKLVESSLKLSNFLINNIINKNENQRPLPDTNLVNSMLLFPGLFNNEGFQIENQREYCDQILLNGLNNYKKEYKEFEMNKKKEDISFDYYSNNPVSTTKIFVNDAYKFNLDKEIKKNEINDQYINDDIKNKIKDKSQNEIMENKDNNSDKDNYNDNILYQPKKIKKMNKYPIYKNTIKFNKEKYINNKEDFSSNNIENNNTNNKDKITGNKSCDDEDEKNKNKSKSINNYLKNEIIYTKNKTININKGNYIRKKKFINKKEVKNDLNDNIRNLSKNNKDYYSYRSSNKSKSNNNKNNKNENGNKKINQKVKNKINTNIKPKIRGISDEKKIDKRNNTFDLINDDYSYGKVDKIKKRKKEITNLNNIERNNSFDIINNNKSLWRNNKIEIEKLSNFNINSKDNSNIKNNRYNNAALDNNNYNNSNIEFKSEYKKSRIYLRENNNDDFEQIKNITKSSLKDYINKEADIIKHNPNYINSQINRNKKDKLNGEFGMNKIREERINNTNNNINNKNRYKNLYFDSNNTNITENISNIYSNNINDTSGNSIKSKFNKLKNYNNSNQQTLIKIDLRPALSTLKNKNNSNL